MKDGKPPRHRTPEYQKARALAEDLDDRDLAVTIDLLRTMLAAYGDVQFSRRKRMDPEKLIAVYQALADRESAGSGS
ncbi:MAG: hypothetical protein F8N37_12715 [Telmatospirillum sp.]|nr:hypothetical protein [Telmatospirillum sp.]